MNIIKLDGGLGNQLFQYAFGRQISLLNKEEFKLDLFAYAKKKKRSYLLDYFNITVEIANDNEVKTQKNFFNLFLDKISFWLPYFKKNIVREKFNFYDKNLKKAKDSYFDGYWQSYKYFESIEDVVRKEITLKNESEKFKNLKFKINTENSVSLHVRRGDYVSVKQNVYFQCGADYYQKALGIIEKKIDNIIIYIFSDDVDWVKENLKFDYPVVYVSEFGFADYEEMILMSNCKHNIIVNSTFSWWGGWLNDNKDKIVVSPKKWYLDLLREKHDLIFGDWIKI